MNSFDMIVSIMEMNELRYFLAVAKTENVNKAASNISISAGSISKAIAKLESELGVSLFERVGRNIKITYAGKELQKKASKIIELEEATRWEIGGHEEEINIVICGEELLLSKYGVEFSQEVVKLYPSAKFSFVSCDGQSALKKLEYGEVHIVLTTSKPPKTVKSKLLEKVKFSTCVGKKHPLYKYVRKSKSIGLEDVREYDFVVPKAEILGQVRAKGFEETWHSDSFRQAVKYQVSSIKILETLVLSGSATAYIPDYLVESLDVGVLDIINCPYDSQQTVYMACRDPKDISWLNQVW